MAGARRAPYLPLAVSTAERAPDPPALRAHDGWLPRRALRPISRAEPLPPAAPSSRTDKAYKAKCRQLAALLRAPRAACVRRRLRSGELSAAEACALDPAEVREAERSDLPAPHAHLSSAHLLAVHPTRSPRCRCS